MKIKRRNVQKRSKKATKNIKKIQFENKYVYLLNAKLEVAD